MSTFKVNDSVVNDSVKRLRTLLGECEKLYNKSLPISTQDKGKSHEELKMLCENIRTNCSCIGELINGTINFLGQTNTMFKTSDQNSASKITGNN